MRWYLIAWYPENQWLVLLGQMLHAITYGLYHSVIIQLIDQFFQGRYQVRGQALYTSVSFGVGGALGSAISGIIWTAYGANNLFFAASILMLLATLFSFLFINLRDNNTY